MRKRRTTAVLIALVFVAALAMPFAGLTGPASAGDDYEIDTAIEAGFGGMVRAGSWVPLTVDMENRGRDFDGELRVDGNYNQMGFTDQSLYIADVVLPQGSHKRITLYIPLLSAVPRIEVELVSGGKTVDTFEEGVSIVGEQDLFVGVIGQKLSAWNILSTLPLPIQGSRVEVALIDPAEFPERTEVLEAFDIIALGDVPAQSLSSAALEALEGWTAGGGTLVLPGGAVGKTNLKGLPEALLPVTPGDPFQLSSVAALEELGNEAITATLLPTVTGNVVTAGRVLVQEGDVPLAVLGDYGNGRVLFLAFDPAAQPLAGWAGMTSLWEALLFQTLPPSYFSSFQYISVGPMGISDQWLYNLYNAVSYLPSLEIPSVNLLIGLIAGYILLVGPGSYFLLRKLKRPGLAWVTIPVLVLVFSSGAFLLAMQSKGNDVQVSTAAIVERMPDTDWARVRRMAGVFSPSEADYSVGISGDSLVGSWNANWGGSTASDASTTIRNRAEGSEAVMSGMGMWTSRSLWMDGMERLENGLDQDLYVEGDRLKGTVRNAGNGPLGEVWLITGSNAQELGELGPGEAATVDVPLTDNTAGLSFVNAQAIFNTNPPQGDTDEWRQWQQRQQVLQAAMNNQVTDVPAGVCAYLVYWTDASLLEITVDKKYPIEYSMTVFIEPVKPEVRGTFALPGGILTGNIERIDAKVEGPAPGMMVIREGEIIYRFDVPAMSSVDNLTVQWPLSSGPAGTQGIEVLAYNWTDNIWDKLELGTANLPMVTSVPGGGIAVPVPAPKSTIIRSSGGVVTYVGPSYAGYSNDVLEAKLPDQAIPADYVSGSGTVRIRLVLNTGTSLQTGVPSLALQGVAE